MNLSKKKLYVAIPVVLLLTLLDLWTKRLISTRFTLGQTKPVIPGFINFTLVHNYGAAFGVGQKWSMIFFMIVSIVAVGLVVTFFLKLRPEEKLSYIGLIFILAGAFGNLIDRGRFGYVVDFIDVYHNNFHWWVFNVADSWITIGAFLFGIEMLIKKPSSIK